MVEAAREGVGEEKERSRRGEGDRSLSTLFGISLIVCSYLPLVTVSFEPLPAHPFYTPYEDLYYNDVMS